MSAPETGGERYSSVQSSVRGRLSEMRRRWRRDSVERLLGSFGVIAALATLLLFLLLSGCESSITYDYPGRQGSELAVDRSVEEESGPGAHGKDRCIPLQLARDAPRVVMISAGGPDAAKPKMLSEAIQSYLGARVEAVTFAEFDPASLTGALALVIYGDETITNEARASFAVDAAQRAETSVIWIGPGAYAAEGTLDVTLDDTGVAFDPAPEGSVLIYNDRSVPADGLLMAEAVVDSPAEPMRRLAEYRSPGGASHAAISGRSDFLHIGFDPLDGFLETYGLVIAMDSMADMVRSHDTDPRVVFRLEDLNPYEYGDDDTILPAVSDYLFAHGAFLHLAAIPEYVDTSGTVLGDVGDMPTLRELVESYPDKTTLVQHGYRHHREHPRNAGQPSGEAYEFYYDDDETLGPARAAALAAERMDAGRKLIELHLKPVWAFEAPHYEMSAAQEKVAEDRYDMILHRPLHRDGTISSVETLWFTVRDDTAYAPSSAGYIDLEEENSVDRILETLALAAALVPDPVMVVYFHPYIWNEPGGRAELIRLIDGMESLGYRFVSACDQVSRPGL